MTEVHLLEELVAFKRRLHYNASTEHCNFYRQIKISALMEIHGSCFQSTLNMILSRSISTILSRKRATCGRRLYFLMME